jgi:Tol biopolymer transport system component
MALASGVVLGPYQIVSILGAGGMGEVYRARDLRLGRDVALKVLHSDVIGKGEARRRFVHEASTAGGLNHPNLVAVYDVNLEGDNPYIVTELVEGESLFTLLKRGTLTVRKLLDIAVQIADGMAAAHQAAIVHRDLKPANILLTKEGRVKIADFGLAKSLAASATVLGENAPTAPMSRVGIVHGTVEYMSPEQARGEAVDTRSDIFSFGLILYEMATGERPFERRSAVETLGATINSQPPPLPEELPAPLQWCIMRCLAKEPQERYNSTLDLHNELRGIKEHVVGSTGVFSRPIAARKPKPVRAGRSVGLWAAAGAAAAGIVAGLLWMVPPSAPDLAALRYAPLATSAEWEDWPSWSPKGDILAYHARVDGRVQIFTRSLQAATGVQITHCPASCAKPVWSADGRQIFLASNGGVAVVGAAGGDPKPVVPNAEAFALSPDGRTLAFIRGNIGASGGISVWTSSPPGAEPVHYQPAPFEGVDAGSGLRLSFTPDGRSILMWGRFFGRGSEFWMLPFPAGGGTPRRVMQKLIDAFPVRGFGWLPGGREIVLAATLPPESYKSHLYIADVATGDTRLLVGGIGSESFPAVSPTGKQIAYTAMEFDADVVEVPLDGSPHRNLIATSRLEHAPVWSPKGRELAYVTDRSGVDEIWVRNVETGRETPVVTPRSFPNQAVEFMTSPEFSPDGERIALVRHNRENAQRRDATEIWIAPVNGGAPVQLTSMPGAQWAPTWSPDGNWIAFTYQGPPEGVMKARVGGNEPAEMLWPLDTWVDSVAPEWSPKGDWIAVPTRKGLMLLSPDGKTKRIVRERAFGGMTWSRDGSTIYGMDESGPRERIVAFDVATRKEREVATVPAGLALLPLWFPGQRMSLAPDGKSLATTAIKQSGDVWLLEHFEPVSFWRHLLRR